MLDSKRPVGTLCFLLPSFLLLSLLSSCSGPSSEIVSDAPPPQAYLASRVESRLDPEKPERTPEVPLTLEQAIGEALGASPELEQIQSRIQAAAALVEQAGSAHYPRLVLSEEFNRTDNPVYGMMNIINQRRLEQGTDFNDPGWQQNWATRIRGEWTVYDFGSTAHDRSAARNRQHAAEAELRSARNRLVGTVTEVYYRWLQALNFIGVARRSLDEADVNERLGEARVRAGAALQSELLRLRSRRAETRGNLVSAETSARRLQAGLERLMARRIAPAEAPDPAALEALPEPPPPDAKGLVDRALEQRPEIAAARYMILAARDRVRSADGALWPEVGVFAQYELNSERLDEFERSGMFGAQVALPLYTGGFSSARIREAEAQLREVEAMGVQIALDVALEVTHAVLAVEEAAERIRAARERKSWAQGALEETRKLYEKDVVTVDALLQAELEWNRAEVSHTSAVFDGRTAAALLGQALGDFAGWIGETRR